MVPATGCVRSTSPDCELPDTRYPWSRASQKQSDRIDQLGLESGHRTLLIHRKAGKTVTIPLAPRTARAVDLVVGERCNGPIFCDRAGGRLDRHGAARIVRRGARRAGIHKRVGAHTLLRVFTAALDAGVALHDVQEAASHAGPRTSCPPTSPARPANNKYPLRTRQNERRAGIMRPWQIARRRFVPVSL